MREDALANALKTVEELGDYKKICALSEEQMREYQALLNQFKAVNSGSLPAAQKGAALENLVSYLLKISGGIFSVVKNIKTGTNEIDEIVELNTKGKALVGCKILSERYEMFLGECKNYAKKIDVTYVGKFYSLLQTTCIRTGILFSYYGVSGEKWRYASGLIRKIYLQREDLSKRVAIIDFSLPDFERIAKGDNFLEIIDEKLKALQFDTSIESFISRHPAETGFREIG